MVLSYFQISQGQHIAVLCDNYTTLIGISIGGHGAVLYGHHIGINLGLLQAVLCNQLASLIARIQGQNGAVLCGYHASLVGLSLR